MKSISVCNHTRDKQIGLLSLRDRTTDFVITRPIVLLSIHHKNYNFQRKEDQNSQVMKERKIRDWRNLTRALNVIG